MKCPKCGAEMKTGYLFGSKDGAISFANEVPGSILECKRSRWFCGDQTIKSRRQNKYRSQLLHGMQNGGISVLIAE